MKPHMLKKQTALLLLLAFLLLTACGAGPEEPETPPPSPSPQADRLAVCLGGTSATLDPASTVAPGCETILYHLYENLLRWEDGGDGWAVLANGQAESYTIETDYAGNATYTFKLREGIRWSDGTAVKAQDFVFAWRRLADPANDLPHRTLMSVISGYAEVQETGDTTLLAVTAPDSKTLTVALNGSPAHFLETVCAGAYTMPLRENSPSYAIPSVTNGAYTLASRKQGEITLARSETYYAPAPKGPESIQFIASQGAEADAAALAAGEAALISVLPAETLQALSGSGVWTPDPVTSTCGVLLNCKTPPFDNANVRLAFHLSIDHQAVADGLGDLTIRPAPGIVPYGVSDFSQRPPAEEPIEDNTLPDPMLQQPEAIVPDPTCWDFRTHSQTLVTAEHTHDHESDCNYAKALMAQAGYPNGAGFPAVEYLYLSGSAEGRTLAALLAAQWKECLGVSITLRAVGEEEYQAAFIPVLPEEGEEDEDAGTETEPEPTAPFQMAAMEFAPAYSDAGLLLENWHSGAEENVSGYASPAFDILLDAAKAAVSPDARDAYLHDAEAILLEDSPVIPVFCRGSGFQLASGLTGLYRAPDGVFFLYNVQAAAQEG